MFTPQRHTHKNKLLKKHILGALRIKKKYFGWCLVKMQGAMVYMISTTFHEITEFFLLLWPFLIKLKLMACYQNAKTIRMPSHCKSRSLQAQITFLTGASLILSKELHSTAEGIPPDPPVTSIQPTFLWLQEFDLHALFVP